jgi:hypothetical protein
VGEEAVAKLNVATSIDAGGNSMKTVAFFFITCDAAKRAALLLLTASLREKGVSHTC